MRNHERIMDKPDNKACSEEMYVYVRIHLISGLSFLVKICELQGEPGYEAVF